MRFTLGRSILSRLGNVGQTGISHETLLAIPRRMESEVAKRPKVRKTYKVMKKVNVADDVLAERQFIHMRVSQNWSSRKIILLTLRTISNFFLLDHEDKIYVKTI